MNDTKQLFNIKQFIYQNSGKVSCCASFLLVLFLNVTGIITFSSILPYIVGLGMWVIFWDLCRHTPLRSISIIPALLISTIICCNLCIEDFLLRKPVIVIAYGIIFLLIRHLGGVLPSERRSKIIHILGSLLFGIFSCAGHYDIFERIAPPIHYPIRFLLLCLLSFCTWSLLFSSALNAYHYIASHIDLQTKVLNQKCILVWLLSFMTCMICYSPYLLTYYPGVIEYDSWIQLRQVFGDTYSNHHPWLHTMLIKALYNIGFFLFHSEKRAVAFYSLFSMGILSAAYATSIEYLYKRGLKRSLLILLLLLYALIPINGIYSITMWKDIPFASTVLFFIILICKLYDNIKQQKSNTLYWLLFIPTGFLMCFFRSNGLYTFILIIPIMLYIFRQQKKSLILSITTVLIMAIIYKGPIFRYFEVQNVDIIESLSIPAQQMAAVISYGGEISDEDLTLLEQIIDINKVPEAYLGSPTCSDAIKDLVRETDNQQYISDHKDQFLAAWLRTGIKNKFYYFKAYAEETKGYWYHKVHNIGFWATYIFEGANGLGIVRECKMPDNAANIIPDLLAWYRTVFDKYFSCGIYIYCLIVSFFESLRQRTEKWFAAIPLLGIWITVLIATPLCSDIRYIFAICTALPFVMAAGMLKTSP